MLTRSANRGFTLVEVLVTVFVVAIGLLAAAGLQAVSKKAAVDAIQRTTATVLAQDMLERIRSNPTQVDQYVGHNINEASPASSTNCGGYNQAACSAEQLVAYDLAQWWQSLDGADEQVAAGDGTTTRAGGLRSPGGCIRRTGDMVEIVVVWRGLSRIRQVSDSPDDPSGDRCFEASDPYERDSDLQSFRRVLRLQAHIRS